MRITKEEAALLLTKIKVSVPIPFRFVASEIELDESESTAWAREIIIGMRLAQVERESLVENE